MTKHLFMSGVGSPDLLEVYGVLFGILLTLWGLNAVYQWLKRKPWQTGHLNAAAHGDVSNGLTDHHKEPPPGLQLQML